MTYLGLINYYTDKLNQARLTKNSIFTVIYHCCPNINNLYELTNVINEEVDRETIIKIKKVMHDYLIKKIPLEYIFNKKEFYGVTFKVSNNVLIPRNETEELVDVVIKSIKQHLVNHNLLRKIELLDLCCGSGVIGISIKHRFNEMVNLTMTDISPDAIQNTCANLQELKMDAKVIQSNLFNNINNKFDIIVFNPPYIAYNHPLEESVIKYEPKKALFAAKNGLYYYEKILSQIKNYLNDNYLVAMEIGYDQANEVKQLVMQYLGEYPKIIKDANGNDRIVLINRLSLC